MPVDTETDYLVIELHVRPTMLGQRSLLTAQERLDEDDALTVLLGRQALAIGRRALRERSEDADQAA